MRNVPGQTKQRTHWRERSQGFGLEDNRVRSRVELCGHGHAPSASTENVEPWREPLCRLGSGVADVGLLDRIQTPLSSFKRNGTTICPSALAWFGGFVVPLSLQHCVCGWSCGCVWVFLSLSIQVTRDKTPPEIMEKSCQVCTVSGVCYNVCHMSGRKAWTERNSSGLGGRLMKPSTRNEHNAKPPCPPLHPLSSKFCVTSLASRRSRVEIAS